MNTLKRYVQIFPFPTNDKTERQELENDPKEFRLFMDKQCFIDPEALTVNLGQDHSVISAFLNKYILIYRQMRGHSKTAPQDSHCENKALTSTIKRPKGGEQSVSM